jgi:hypothetical protein
MGQIGTAGTLLEPLTRISSIPNSFQDELQLSIATVANRKRLDQEEEDARQARWDAEERALETFVLPRSRPSCLAHSPF